MAIVLRSVAKMFPSLESNRAPTHVLHNIELEVADGRIVALFGPNGCGKTTILNIIAGIEIPDLGTISVESELSSTPRLGYAFQNFHEVLLPWQSAFDNVTFGLLALGYARSAAREIAISFLDRHGLMFPRRNYPYELSVGQQQMVAIARALIQKPRNLLLDEPFSALDHETRFRMHDVLGSILEPTTSIVVVSHDIDEALYLSDELYLLSKRPARVVEKFSVPFGRPRGHDLLVTSDFASLRGQVIASFLREVAA